ncbi:MAG: insulinase family protein, partial [Colwellia sp.]|nr:insulinase family protein [Colwellia sp.]
YINADNMRVIHVSQNNSFSQTSLWYQVPYSVNKISAEKLTLWRDLSTPSNTNSKVNEALFLPQANPYITGSPTIYDNVVEDNTLPTKIEDCSGLAVWYKQDTTFKVPKGHIYLGIDSPYSIESIDTIAMTRLFVDLYTNTVVEENYDAELAGIHYHLYSHQGGITLQLSGISENQPQLLEKLLYRLTHHDSSGENFVLFKRQLIKHWQNSDKSKSISQLFSTLSSLMQPNNPSADELSEALTKITFSQYQVFCQKLFNQITIEVLVHGNWLIEHVTKIVTNIKQAFANNYSNKHAVQCPVVDITNKGTLILPMLIPDHDHASVVYTPLPIRDENLVALTMVTSHLLSPLFFQEMRTEKQYGYLVGVGYVPINRYPGIAFYIQSPHIDSIALTKAIDEFITDSLEMLTEISDENWLHLINGLAGQLQEKDNNLRIKSQRFWAAICNKDLTFSHKEQLVTAILALNLKHVKSFIKNQLMTIVNPDRIILSSMEKVNPAITQKIQHELNGEIISKTNAFIKNSTRKY